MDAFGIKDQSSAQFLPRFQQRVVKSGVPTKLAADNALLHRIKLIAKYLLKFRVLLPQSEQKKAASKQNEAPMASC